MANTKEPSGKQPLNVAVIDCETDPFTYNQVPVPFIWGYYNGNDYIEFDDTLALVSFLRTRAEIVYAHNGGKFDFHFLFDYIDSFSELKIINNRLVSVRIGMVELRDSYAIIPVALEQYEKMKFDYSKLRRERRHKYMGEIREYLKSDCTNLYQLVIDFIIRFGDKLTLASTAVDEVCKIQNFNRRILRSSRSIYERVHDYYHGGRVQAFAKGTIKRQTYIYDINSAYPFAMTHSHPIGSDFIVETNGLDFQPINPEAFYHVKGDADSCFATHNDDARLVFPTGHGEYFVTGHELFVARKFKLFHGTILSRLTFKSSVNFKRFVMHYYKLKKDAPKHSTDYLFAKLMLNSFYGKMAANPDKYSEYALIPAEYIKASQLVDGYSLVSIHGDNALVERNIPEVKKRWFNLATAASITGFVRAMLLMQIAQVKSRGHQVYYCDTDSIITDDDGLPCSNKLGDLKLEQINDNLVIIAPKLYAARDAKTHEYKIASKGVELTADEIISIAKGKDVTYRRDAPTFSISNEPRFIERTIRGLNK